MEFTQVKRLAFLGFAKLAGTKDSTPQKKASSKDKTEIIPVAIVMNFIESNLFSKQRNDKSNR